MDWTLVHNNEFGVRWDSKRTSVYLYEVSGVGEWAVSISDRLSDDETIITRQTKAAAYDLAYNVIEHHSRTSEIEHVAPRVQPA